MKITNERTEYIIIKTYYSPYPTVAIIAIDKSLRETIAEPEHILCDLKNLPIDTYTALNCVQKQG